MQQMPDKEFDQLFRDKFTDVEIEPSANLWANIEEKLEPKRKKVFPIYWMAAATVIVVFTALLFLQKDEKVKLQGKSDVIAKVIKEEHTDLQETTPSVLQNRVEKADVKTAQISEENSKATIKQSFKNNLKNFDVALQPSQQNNHLPKQTDTKPLEFLSLEKPLNNEVMIAQVEPQQDLTENVVGETETTERKGIRNVGDLVNFVVDKVDKRENKLIKFNTDDDDNSSIIGINIGFVKLNKKHR